MTLKEKATKRAGQSRRAWGMGWMHRLFMPCLLCMCVCLTLASCNKEEAETAESQSDTVQVQTDIDHIAVTDPAVAATCTASGWTEGSHCSVCGEVLVAQAEIPATGHPYTKGLCPVCGDRKESQGLSYSLNQDGESYAVTGIGTCTDTDLVIPSVYNGKPVTAIGEYACKSGYHLTSVSIPDSVTSIGDFAFYGCRNLTSITIPDSVTSIGEAAFGNCRGLLSVTVGSGVTSMGTETFYGCSKLVEVYNLSGLRIKRAKTNGYVGYYSLHIYTDKDAPSQLFTTEDGYVFYEDGDACYLLGYVGGETNLVLPESCHGKAYGIYTAAFYACTSLESITIPHGVTAIGDEAFYDCRSLTSVTIGNSVTSIGGWAFHNCRSLTSVTISEGVTSIGERAFDYCSGLTSITIPDGVTSIGNFAFYDCQNLTHVTIPDSVTSIGQYAFNRCSRLAEVHYSGTAAQWEQISIASDNDCLTSAARGST